MSHSKLCICRPSVLSCPSGRRRRPLSVRPVVRAVVIVRPLSVRPVLCPAVPSCSSPSVLFPAVPSSVPSRRRRRRRRRLPSSVCSSRRPSNYYQPANMKNMQKYNKMKNDLNIKTTTSQILYKIMKHLSTISKASSARRKTLHESLF